MSSMNSNVGLYEQRLSYRRNSPPCQCLAQPWYIHVPHPVYDPRHYCVIEPLICGEAVFKKIAYDLKRAKHSVDIITWGFDPGMVLVRGATAEDGKRYGDWLIELATRKEHPVEVRLLVWHDDIFAQQHSNNNPGYYGPRFPHIGSTSDSGFYSEFHQSYNAEWYAKVCAGKIPNIHFQVRDVPNSLLDQSLSDESPPSGWKVKAAEHYATHHQKMILIDYEDPAWAIGYVMGHNSITDFGDTEQHLYRDPRRERFYTEDHVAVQREAWKQGQLYDTPFPNYILSDKQQADKERLVQSYIDQHSRITKPYQDVSCRLRGAVLCDLNHNFCQAWEKSKRPAPTFLENCWLAMAVMASTFALGDPRAARNLIAARDRQTSDLEFIQRRQRIQWRDFDVPEGQHNVQLVRTQPLYGEKGVKECYANLTRQALHYIFIQNQYIQYQDWADHLLDCVRNLRAAGYRKPMYVFLLTSTPESDGMDIPTYGVASRVGMSETMRVEHERALREAHDRNTAPPISAADLASQGINVFMGSLWTCAQKEEKLSADDYEEIYIHAKVAIVDDAAFTLGSANLNLRSMALDSELNILSEAKDVTYQLRCDLFSQCSGNTGPAQFADMRETFSDWQTLAAKNVNYMRRGQLLKGQLLPFHVDRSPGTPIV